MPPEPWIQSAQNPELVRLCALTLADDEQNTENPPYVQVNNAKLPPQTGTKGDWAEVRGTAGKGLGLFAARDIPGGTIVLVERPLFILHDHITAAEIDEKVASLTPAQQDAFSSLASYRRNARESTNEAIIHTNTFRIGDSQGAMFAMGCRFNHACCPNMDYTWDDLVSRMLFVSRWNIQQGEELTVNYGTVYQGEMTRYWGFQCDCGRCVQGAAPQTWADFFKSCRDNKGFFALGILPVLWAYLIFYVLRTDRSVLDAKRK